MDGWKLYGSVCRLLKILYETMQPRSVHFYRLKIFERVKINTLFYKIIQVAGAAAPFVYYDVS